MKSEIIRLANRLCEPLDLCNDEEFVEMVCCSVCNNSYIDPEEYEDKEKTYG